MFFVFSSHFFQEIDIQKLKTDPTIIKLKKLNKELMDGTISKYYQLPKNYQEIRKSYGTSPTKEQLIKSLKQNGMAHADEYIEKLFMQTELMKEFLAKNPSIVKMDNIEKAKLFQSLLMN